MNHSVSKHVPSFAKGLQILVVDDDRDTLSIITAMLELCSYKERKYSIIITSTGEVSEALSMIKEQKSKFKLVMASIDIPEMNPYSFLKASLQCGIGVICKNIIP
ncbi:hypothetical protein F8388_010965 [Cannabis sativa]|uniref:Response regulatory domain-containing protein n=1 Tax=Cannabis sativa TaxID=3483 RepID=A0A7J6EE35_CANSA|nr:hypothetical protein F8388_010965 [Cannabis sativa]KAF4396191.1 hypothetical protein G4B88_020828 [Cannabis sativa]